MSITQIFENLKTGWLETRQIDVNRMLAEDLRDAPQPVRPPTPVPATKQLRTNLERVTLAYNDRERVLVAEIAAREAELADVRRARDATTAALMELEVTDMGDAIMDEILDAQRVAYPGGLNSVGDEMSRQIFEAAAERGELERLTHD